MIKIYVGNLPYSTDDGGLKAAFAPFGEVASASVVRERCSGRSKGFGFVEMPDDDQAESAIAGLDGSMIEGRRVNVSEARPSVRRDRFHGDRRDRGDRFKERGDRDRRDSDESRW